MQKVWSPHLISFVLLYVLTVHLLWIGEMIVELTQWPGYHVSVQKAFEWSTTVSTGTIISFMSIINSEKKSQSNCIRPWSLYPYKIKLFVLLGQHLPSSFESIISTQHHSNTIGHGGRANQSTTTLSPISCHDRLISSRRIRKRSRKVNCTLFDWNNYNDSGCVPISNHFCFSHAALCCRTSSIFFFCCCTERTGAVYYFIVQLVKRWFQSFHMSITIKYTPTCLAYKNVSYLSTDCDRHSPALRKYAVEQLIRSRSESSGVDDGAAVREREMNLLI